MAKSFDDFLSLIEDMTQAELIAAYASEDVAGPRLSAIADEMEMRGMKCWPKDPGQRGGK